MFEGVNDIKWEQFGETHIAVRMKTREIPHHIRNMLYEDSDEREYSIAGLLGEGQHLGMLDKATPYIIPFVLEVLTDQHYEQRGYLMHGLARMFDHMFASRSFEYLRLALQTYDEIKKGYVLYRRLLGDSQTYVRFYTANVIAYMQDNSLDALSSLSAHLAVETDADNRGAIIKAILRLVEDSLNPYSREGTRIINSLYLYLKAKGSFEEQVQFARTLKEMGFGIYPQVEIMNFMKEILARTDAEDA